LPEADPCRRSLSSVEEARLFARDALRAARGVLAGNPADEVGSAYLAVFAVLAVAALFPEMDDAGRTCGASREA
jgi:hypothetical protein